MPWQGFEPQTSRLTAWHANHYTIELTTLCWKSDNKVLQTVGPGGTRVRPCHVLVFRGLIRNAVYLIVVI